MAAAILPYHLALPPPLGFPLWKKGMSRRLSMARVVGAGAGAGTGGGGPTNVEAVSPFWVQTAGYPSISRVLIESSFFLSFLKILALVLFCYSKLTSFP